MGTWSSVAQFEAVKFNSCAAAGAAWCRNGISGEQC